MDNNVLIETRELTKIYGDGEKVYALDGVDLTITDGLTGKPIAGARLNAGDVADLQKDAVTQEDGSFVLTGLLVGSQPVRVTITADGYARTREQIKVQQGLVKEQSFELQPTARIEGVVLNSNGDPIRNARVGCCSRPTS